MTTIAFLFPGQGSQSVGMGAELHREYDFVREIFDMAEEISRLPIARLCFKGPMESLTETVNLQPAVTAVNLACLAAAAHAGIQPARAAGHSLGEYSALRAAGVLDAPDAFRLVFRRGELMHREAGRHPGAMAAIVGLPIDEVQSITESAASAGPVSVANHNTETQIVVTGSPAGVKRASALSAEAGARAVPLKVSGAWHSELMTGAETDFAAFLETIPFSAPEIPVIHNVTADIESDPSAVRRIMAAQLTHPVRWHESLCRLIDESVDVYVELGPGRVLSGMMRKIMPKGAPGRVFSVSDMKGLDRLVEAVS